MLGSKPALLDYIIHEYIMLGSKLALLDNIIQGYSSC